MESFRRVVYPVGMYAGASLVEDRDVDHAAGTQTFVTEDQAKKRILRNITLATYERRIFFKLLACRRVGANPPRRGAH